MWLWPDPRPSKTNQFVFGFNYVIKENGEIPSTGFELWTYRTSKLFLTHERTDNTENIIYVSVDTEREHKNGSAPERFIISRLRASHEQLSVWTVRANAAVAVAERIHSDVAGFVPNSKQLQFTVVRHRRRLVEKSNLHALCKPTTDTPLITNKQWRNNGVGRVGKVQGAPECKGPPSTKQKKIITVKCSHNYSHHKMFRCSIATLCVVPGNLF